MAEQNWDKQIAIGTWIAVAVSSILGCVTFVHPPDPAHPMSLDFLSKSIAVPPWMAGVIIVLAVLGTNKFLHWRNDRSEPVARIVGGAAADLESNGPMPQRPANPTREVIFCVFDKGFFAKHGIVVKVISAHGDLNTWDAVEKGEAKFGLADPVTMFQRTSTSGRLVATLINKATLWGISKTPRPFSKTLSGLPDASTIRGFGEPTTTYRFMRWMQDAKPSLKIETFNSGEEMKAVEDSAATDKRLDRGWTLLFPCI